MIILRTIFAVILLTTVSSAIEPEYLEYGGTAFLINSDGYMLTNQHIIKDCLSLNVANENGVKKSSAFVVAEDEDLDLAVIKTDIISEHFYPISQYGIEILDEVTTAGFPDPWLDMKEEDIKLSAYRGYISSTGEYDDWDDYLEVDIYATKGQSGSPILNSTGEVIGVLSGAFHFEHQGTNMTDDKIKFITSRIIAANLSWIVWFLDEYKIKYTDDGSISFLDTNDLVKTMRDATFSLTCNMVE